VRHHLRLSFHRLDHVLPILLCLSAIVVILTLTSSTTTLASVSAPTFTVNSTLDGVDANPGDGVCATSGGLCTLRAAIMEANHTPGGGATIDIPGSLNAYTIAIPPSGADDETTGDLNLNASMTIVGKPTLLHPYVIIDASLAQDRVFSIGSATVTISTISRITHGRASYGGGIANTGSLILVGSTVYSNTATSSSSGDGGGIYNTGTLTLTTSTVSDNWAGAFGGGIVNSGSLALVDSMISANTVTHDGGGIWNGGYVTLTNSSLVSNTADGDGGGLYVWGTATLTDSMVLSNTASHGSGGGLYNFWNGSKVTISHSTVSGNTSYFVSGGIDNSGISSAKGILSVADSTISRNMDSGILNQGVLTLTNVTLSDNVDDGLTNEGTAALTNVTLSGNSSAGIQNYQGTALLTNVTINLNNQYGIYQNGSYYTQTVTLSNTLIANTTGGVNCYVYAIPLQSYGYNLSSDGSCAAYLNWPGDLNNTNPQLSPLANNGGSTFTHALLPGSPAIDAIPLGTNGCGTTLITDQRGVPRPQGSACDLGAFELAVKRLYLPLISK
jgi:CSLREA domain-containing protein